VKIITIQSPPTDRFPLIVIVSIILFSLYPFNCFSQNIYDQQHSEKFAEYLSSSHQYKLAAEEYERLIYFDENNLSYKFNLVKNYRLSGDLKTGINRVYYFYGRSPDMLPPVIAKEFLKLQLLSDSLAIVSRITNGKSLLSQENKMVFQSFNLLLAGDYRSAELLAKVAEETYPSFPSGIYKLTKEAGNIRFKSTFVAGSFSAIIPGAGKFYTKNWADGVFSMLFVAGSAWQAYRGFHEHGSKSAYGWTFASISASFYIGNIFGSVKAARKYNKDKRNEINNQVFEFVNSDSY
jgi:hypothetical protein